jgi:hypothetical protein
MADVWRPRLGRTIGDSLAPILKTTPAKIALRSPTPLRNARLSHRAGRWPKPKQVNHWRGQPE